MAKRHHKKHRTHRRRRSGLGAIKPGNIIANIAGVAVGAAAAGFITGKVLGKQSDTIKAVAAIGLGVLTPTFIKSDLGKAAGNGMLAVGVISLLKKSGFVGATDEVEVTLGDVPVIAGDDTMGGEVMAGEVMAGTDGMPVISGYDGDY